MDKIINKSSLNNRIDFLDFLRIFAFVSVLIGHKFYSYVEKISNDQSIHSTPRIIAELLMPLFFGGGAGVVVFFLVSGYIITHVLQTEQTTEFLIKRAFRIFPLYIVALFIQYMPAAFGWPVPPLPVIAQQLFLVGDFFGTPYALNGVEWTLRVEVIFYLFMAATHSFKNLTNFNQLLPYVFVGAVLFCRIVAPVPSIDILSVGYLTIYAPFLLVGSMFYRYEKKLISPVFLILFIGLVFYQYYYLISIYQDKWLGTHFAILAFIIFLICFGLKRYIYAAPWVLVLSDMTYAVYLFHNWMFDYIRMFFAKYKISVFNPDLQALIVLLFVCFLMVKCIEKPGIKIGRTLLAKL